MIVIFGDKREVKKLFWGRGSFLCTCRLQKQPRPRRIARKEAERMIAQVQRMTTLTPLREAADRGDWEELKAYRNTDMTPDEILLASERLVAFEEIGMEPADLMDLVRRDTAKEASMFGENHLCPECGCFHAATKEYAESFPFCEKCGQRIIPPASVPEVMQIDSSGSGEGF